MRPSDYIVGLDCRRRLALRSAGTQPRSGVIAEVDGFTVLEADIDEIPDIRRLGRSLFPDGSPGPVLDAATAGELPTGVYFDVKIVGEETEGTIDVLKAGRHGWELVSIEAGTSVKGAYVSRITFLAELARSVGLDVEGASVVTLDKRYHREDAAIDLDGLFRSHDVSGSVLRHSASVRNSVAGMLDTWLRPETILTNEGYRCRRPDTCEACRRYLPEKTPESIFSLHRGGETARTLYHQGVESLLDIPAQVPLSRFQEIQIDAVRSGAMYADVEGLSTFLARLTFPLLFLDFEALMYAVPRYPTTRPWQHIAFQYSLHRVDRPDGPVEHRSFIAAPAADPRPALVEALQRDLGETGSIVVYGRTFESGVLRRLGGYFSRHEEWARRAIGRVIDLSEPFHSFLLHHPGQRGRVSMKRVLPALTGVGYADQEIGDGRTASVVYQALSCRMERDEPPEPATRRTVFRHLREYCALDTYGMYLIYRRLREIVGAA